MHSTYISHPQPCTSPSPPVVVASTCCYYALPNQIHDPPPLMTTDAIAAVAVQNHSKKSCAIQQQGRHDGDDRDRIPKQNGRVGAYRVEKEDDDTNSAVTKNRDHLLLLGEPQVDGLRERKKKTKLQQQQRRGRRNEQQTPWQIRRGSHNNTRESREGESAREGCKVARQTPQLRLAPLDSNNEDLIMENVFPVPNQRLSK